MIILEFGVVIFKVIFKVLYIEECFNFLKDNYIKRDNCDCFGEKKVKERKIFYGDMKFNLNVL